MGLTAGYIAVTPTLINLLQSCKNKIVLNWTPEILSADEAKVLDQIVDLIIPETDIPGARDLNIPMFIDKYVSNVVTIEEVAFFKLGAGMMIEELGISEEKPVDDIPVEAYDAMLAKYLRMPKEQQIEYRKQMLKITTPEALESMPRDVIMFNFLAAVRDLCIYSYKSTEYVGENVLVYLSVPGEQIGCGSLETLTGGKDWSL